MQRDYLVDIIFCLGCIACGWIIQRLIFVDTAIYAPAFGWVLTEKETVVLYYLLLLGNIVLFAFSRGRDLDIYNFSLLAGFPLEIFLVLLYSNYLVKVLWIALVFFCIYTIWALYQLVRRVLAAKLYGRRLRIGWAMRRSFGKIHSAGGLILCIVALYITLGPVRSKTLWTPEETSGIKGESRMDMIQNVEGALWDNNQEGMKNLRQEIFQTLSDDEKVASLQFILDLELTYLGCEPVQLIAQDFEDPGLHGYYNNDKRIVALNDDLLQMASYECIKVCLHEAYHAYQYACIESIDFDRVDTDLRMYKDLANWKYEFEHYSSASGWSTWNEYEKYANQEVEKTANAYADEWCWHYYAYIEELTDE